MELDEKIKGEIVEAIATIGTPGRIHPDQIIFEMGGNAWSECGKLHVHDKYFKKYFTVQFTKSHCTGSYNDDYETWDVEPDEFPYLEFEYSWKPATKIILNWENTTSMEEILKEVFLDIEVCRGHTIIVKQGYKITY